MRACVRGRGVVCCECARRRARVSAPRHNAAPLVKDDGVCRREVDAEPAGARREQKEKVGAPRRLERSHAVAALGEAAGAVEAQVRAAVGTNPSTQHSTLRELALDDDVTVHAAIAGNPSCPIDLLECFVDNPNFTVQQALASNHSLPQAMLEVRWAQH